MPLIKSVHVFSAGRPTDKRALVLCGFGGSVWQVRRLIQTLNQAGYDVTALDFPPKILRDGDAALLPRLVDEVVAFAEEEAAKTAKPPVLIGVSLGALMALNIVRRSARFDAGVLITGGDIVKIARKLFPRAWRNLPYEKHAEQWRHINMYTDPRLLKAKRLLFVLPARDRLVSQSDLHREITTQQQAGNSLVVVRRSAGHFATIIAETMLFPRRTLAYLKNDII